MTKKDVFLILIFVIPSLIAGWGAHSFTHPKVVTTVYDDSKSVRKEDSLRKIISCNSDSITVYKQHIQHTDSLVILNRKKLSYDDKLIKNFTISSRKHYLDSLFKSAGL